MSVKLLTILVIYNFFCCSNVTAQRCFNDSLRYLFERKAVRMQGNMLSDVVFVEYSAKTKKMTTKGQRNSLYKKSVEEVIANDTVSKLIKDSGAADFILPIYFMTLNDDSKEIRDDEFVFAQSTIENMLLINQSNKMVLSPARIIIYNRKRVE